MIPGNCVAMTLVRYLSATERGLLFSAVTVSSDITPLPLY